MRIVTPSEVATQTQNKYLGVLVAAKFARFVNEFPRDRSVDFEEKLTTRALDELVRGRLTYKLVRRRGPGGRWRLPAGTSPSAGRGGAPGTRAVRAAGGSPR